MPAPKGNTFAIGNSGKPKRWDTVEDLQEDIDSYFEECDSHTREMFVKSMGEVVEMPWPKPYTIEGLCEYLDCDRKTLLNYGKQEGYEEFFHAIKRAKNKIQRDKVERGLSGQSNSSVTIFDLKNNHGYTDSSEIDLKSSDGSMSPPQNLKELYDAEAESES
jgi:hypothetical protein